MGLFGTRRPAPYVEPTPAIKAETCVACHTSGHAMQLLDLGDLGPQWVCVSGGPCNDRAAAGGVWEGRPR